MGPAGEAEGGLPQRGGCRGAPVPTHSHRCRRAWQPLQDAARQSLSPFHVPTLIPPLQLALRFRESFAYDLGLRASRWVMATLEGAAAAAWRVLLGWRARLSRWRVAGMAPREASSEAGEVELQTVQLTAADSAAMDAAPSEASFEGGA